jgi:phage shock protein A
MAIINRIARLFQADFHAVLDRIEEPAQLLRQAVRDMEDELAASEQQIGIAAQEHDSLLARKSGLEQRLADLEQELDLCFASHKEQLARGLIRRKLEGQRLLSHIASRQATLGAQLQEQRARLAHNRMTLEAMQQKAAIFAERAPDTTGTAADEGSWIARGLAVGEDEIDIAFLREQQARSAP